MKLSQQDVLDIALLARLELSEDEIAQLQTELGNILDYIDSLRDLDTEGAAPMTHAVPMEQRLREDVVGPAFESEVALADAPESADDSFRVPHIIQTATRGDS